MRLHWTGRTSLDRPIFAHFLKTCSCLFSLFCLYCLYILIAKLRRPRYTKTSCVRNPWHAGTELSRFNQVNIMVADAISNHDIDCVNYVSPGLIRGGISIIDGMSVWWRNDIKCKYMFTFPLKNLARTDLTFWSLQEGQCVNSSRPSDVFASVN